MPPSLRHSSRALRTCLSLSNVPERMGSINTDRDGKERRKRTLRRWFWRGLLLIVGVLAVGAMIRQLGWAQIAQTVVTTAPWLPLICALDLLWVAVEGG